LLIVLSGFLGVGRACLEACLYSCGLKYDRVTSLYGPASSGGNMRANLDAFEHNNLDGMTLFPAPKYGHTLLRSWARKHRSAITWLKIGARILWVKYSSRMERMESKGGRLIGLRCLSRLERGAFSP
jgi:hypothetical protein